MSVKLRVREGQKVEIITPSNRLQATDDSGVCLGCGDDTVGESISGDHTKLRQSAVLGSGWHV